MISRLSLQITGNHPGFDHRDTIGDSDLFYPVHSHQGNSYASLFWNAPSDIAKTGATRGHRNFSLVREAQQLGNLLGRSRLYDSIRKMTREPFVPAVCL